VSDDPGGLHAVLGDDGVARIVAAFYRRIPDDPILGPMYPDGDLAGAEARLRDFLLFRLGGPTTYLETRGHPRLRMRHAPFPIDQVARDRWMELMTAAVSEADIGEAGPPLLRFLADVATFLRNR